MRGEFSPYKDAKAEDRPTLYLGGATGAHVDTPDI